MIRVEIIANRSIEEDLFEAFSHMGVANQYTKYPVVYGKGSSGPRMGDAIWPEENFALVVWCEEDEARSIMEAAMKVKARFPDEGLKVFGVPAG